MKPLDNSANIGIEVEPKDGERGPLSSNTADVRSPSLCLLAKKGQQDDDSALQRLARILVKAYLEDRDAKAGCKEDSRSNILPGLY